MSKNIPRKHHYVPVFYLANFTPSGRKDDLLYVHDIDRRQSRQMTPKSIAFQKGYNTLQVEESLSEFFEGPAATVIREILKTEELPAGQDFVILMMFLLSLAVRVPIVRDYEAGMDARNIKNHLRYLAENDPKELAERVESLRDSGIKLPDNMSAENLKSMDWSDFSVEFPVQWHMLNMLDLMKVDLPLLTERQWMLNIAEDGAGDFICSDKPVIAHPLSTKRFRQIRFIRPDFQKDTIVIMPLSRRIALTGEFKKERSGSADADAKRVSLINGFLAAPAEFTTSKEGKHVMRYIYSPDSDFSWWMPQGKVGNLADLWKSLPKR